VRLVVVVLWVRTLLAVHSWIRLHAVAVAHALWGAAVVAVRVAVLPLLAGIVAAAAALGVAVGVVAVGLFVTYLEVGGVPPSAKWRTRILTTEVAATSARILVVSVVRFCSVLAWGMDRWLG
jgi:hypothetical protein